MNILKKYFAIIISFSLVITGMLPVQAELFLSPPGESELAKSLLLLEMHDDNTARASVNLQNMLTQKPDMLGGLGAEDRVEVISVPVAGKTREDVEEISLDLQLFLLEELSGWKNAYCVAYPHSKEEHALCRDLGLEGIYPASNETIVELLTPNLKDRNAFKIERISGEKEYDNIKVTFSESIKTAQTEILDLVFVPRDEYSFYALQKVFFQSKDPLPSRLHSLAWKPDVQFDIYGLPMVIKDDEAKRKLLLNGDYSGEGKFDSCLNTLCSSNELGLPGILEVRKLKELKPSQDFQQPASVKKKKKKSSGSRQKPAGRHKKPEDSKPVLTLIPKVGENVADDDYWRRLEICLQPFFMSNFPGKRLSNAYSELRKLLLSKEEYKHIIRHAAMQFNKKYKGSKKWQVNPETLVISGNTICKKGYQPYDDPDSINGFAGYVRKLMLAWDGLKPFANFTDDTVLGELDDYGSFETTLPYGDSDVRAYFETAIERTCDHAWFLGRVDYVTLTFVGVHETEANREYENLPIFLADHWAVRKMGYSRFFPGYYIAWLLVSSRIRDVQIREPLSADITPCGLRVMLDKPYVPEQNNDYKDCRFFILKKPLKKSTEETIANLDDIEYFKDHIEFDREKYEELAWKKGDMLGNIERAKKLLDLARKGLLLSQSYWIANDVGVERIMKNLKEHGLPDSVSGVVEYNLRNDVYKTISLREKYQKDPPEVVRKKTPKEFERLKVMMKIEHYCFAGEPDTDQRKRIVQMVETVQQTGIPKVLYPAFSALLQKSGEHTHGDKPDWVIQDKEFNIIMSVLRNSSYVVKNFCKSAESFADLFPDDGSKDNF